MDPIVQKAFDVANYMTTLSNYDEDMVLIDDNHTPISIENLKNFLETLIVIYQSSINEYYTKYSQLKNSRSVETLVK